MKSPEYIVHGTSSDDNAEKIVKEGFVAEEGRATVSTDLIMAFKWANDRQKMKASRGEAEVSPDDLGRIVFMKTPEDKVVDYGEDTNINIDEEDKKISGFVSRYKSARRYLALYNEKNDDSDSVTVPEENILMSIIPSPELGEKLNEVKRKIEKLEGIDFNKTTEELSEIIESNPDNYIKDTGAVREIVRNLLISTLESEVMSIARGLYVQIKRAQGYTVENEGVIKQENDSPTLDELKGKLDLYKAKIESGGFDTGIDTLNRYIQISFKKLMKELESGNLA